MTEINKLRHSEITDIKERLHKVERVYKELNMGYFLRLEPPSRLPHWCCVVCASMSVAVLAVLVVL